MLRRSAAEHPGQILKRHTMPGAALSRWAGSLTRGLSRSAGPCWAGDSRGPTGCISIWIHSWRNNST